MAEPTQLEARIKRLEDLEAIKCLKHKYFRTLDTKQWDEFAECFTEDACTSYSDGQYRFQGIYAIMKFIKRGLARYHFFGLHHGHHPEITLTSDVTAKGIWALHNYMIDTQEHKSILINAFYHDEYVKVNGNWKIKFTSYDRVFEESWLRSDIASLKLDVNMFSGRPAPF